jgi:hypothetical protein
MGCEMGCSVQPSRVGSTGEEVGGMHGRAGRMGPAVTHCAAALREGLTALLAGPAR